ncbi:MAG: FHA domain-containing protein [Deltaproteobacteria bacterium]|nr:FHA domain-containing protein [Deltaproteobacteria bacterium]
MASYWITYEGTRFPIRLGETVVGRSAYCTIVVSDGSVSREHASLRLVDGVLKVVDLGSRNGTFVNGLRLTDARVLKGSDVVVLGSAVLNVIATEEDPLARRDTMGVTDTPLPFSSDPPTTASTTTLDLIESMVARADSSGRAIDFVPTLKSMIESAADFGRATGKTLKPEDLKRLVAAAATVASWEPAGALDVWYASVSRRTGGK